MYRLLLKPILFLFSPESAHKMIIGLLKFLHYIPFSGAIFRLFYSYKNKKLERELFGIKFPNPVGLAAGLDKNGEVYNEMANMGFGFIEIGSLTPQPQPGNPKPRCFRLVRDKAIINRMGINNKGSEYALKRLSTRRARVIIGANITKLTSTPNESAPTDYEAAFIQLYDYADYFALNVSCPNVKDLTGLQEIDSLSAIVNRLIAERATQKIYKPILLKISPDITFEHLDKIIELIIQSQIDGIIATNTTRGREGLTTSSEVIDSIGDGGLSGAPLFGKSLEFVTYLKNRTSVPIIAVGGIMRPAEAIEMLKAGAALIQIYSGFIYSGPGIVRKVLKHIVKSNIS
jgi:dihydroorotate dehydrogenase, subfamily 2